LVEHCLQSSGEYSEAGQLIEFFGGSEMCDVLYGGFRDVCQSVTEEGGDQNWSKVA